MFMHATQSLKMVNSVDRDKLEPKHFQKWVDFAKERGMGLDFNPTFFSHPMVKDGLTLSSPDEEVRNFWIEHGKALHPHFTVFCGADRSSLCNEYLDR